jgi:hypothetical protein
MQGNGVSRSGQGPNNANYDLCLELIAADEATKQKVNIQNQESKAKRKPVSEENLSTCTYWKFLLVLIKHRLLIYYVTSLFAGPQTLPYHPKQHE